MRRTLALFATLYLLWAILSQANHALSSLRVYLFGGGLYVAFAALTQPRRSGFAAVVLGAALCDATTPVIFGTHMLLFGLAHAVLLNVRDRVPRDDTLGQTIVTLLTNLALFLAFCFTQMDRTPVAGALWPRLFVDLICSQIFLALITPWFFALQARTLTLARVERENFA